MDKLLYLIIFCILLAVVSYQDFKDRAIDWFLPIFLIGNALLLHFRLLSGLQWTYILGNLTIICIQLFVLCIYFSIKSGNITNIVNRQLGLGDILFFLPITILFSPLHFIAFFVVSLIVTLLSAVLLRFIKKIDNTSIPLAGAMSLVLIIWLICASVLDINLYDDYFWLSYVPH